MENLKIAKLESHIYKNKEAVKILIMKLLEDTVHDHQAILNENLSVKTSKIALWSVGIHLSSKHKRWWGKAEM